MNFVEFSMKIYLYEFQILTSMFSSLLGVVLKVFTMKVVLFYEILYESFSEGLETSKKKLILTVGMLNFACIVFKAEETLI